MYDGVPQLIKYDDASDHSKYLKFHLPSGNSTLSFYVKSKTNGFFPELLFGLYSTRESVIDYPPSEVHPFKV